MVNTRSGITVYGYVVSRVGRGGSQKSIAIGFVKNTKLSWATIYNMMHKRGNKFTKFQIVAFCKEVGLSPAVTDVIIQEFKDDGRFYYNFPGHKFKKQFGKSNLQKQAQKQTSTKQGVSMSKVRKTRNPATPSGKIVSKAISEKHPNLPQKKAWEKISEETKIPEGTLERATYPKIGNKCRISTARKIARALNLNEHEYFKSLKEGNLIKTLPDSVQIPFPIEGETKITPEEYGLIKRMGAVENSVEKRDFEEAAKILIGLFEDALKGNGYVNPWVMTDLKGLKKKVSII